MIYDLVPANHAALKTAAPLFDFNNPPIDPLDLASDLAETMLHHHGIGIAANQVGLPHRVFILRTEELLPCFNPRVVDFSDETVYLEEGCLTHPGFFVKIKRPRRVKVRFTEPNGNVVTRVFHDMTARVFAHEVDHLNGIDPFSRANKIHMEQAKSRYKKYMRGLKK